MNEASHLWYVPESGSLVWRSFDSYSLLYNERSGNTHVLDPLSREILDLLQESPRDERALLQELTSLVGDDDPEALREAIGEALVAFDSAGLIFPAYHS
ncbi:HPr-rel-A system PqqD family peptide chaperone [Denitrobaculum tricleocarpae]|uniref:HPr-rel-A system PqqD family peptide chaperone n=1 Tax=Denitrobaculum tricleocarpae TaxID=2591009 RepID=A0A545U2I8_9PROT|nr:HPr-rel-A system PqqD family peptide chaperone [Denitrobaculum tricleocarpae]TQV83666.1 HPr-rel-A system PqqD family peptide chaperone [Denitrobaculum tricleocarpae]